MLKTTDLPTDILKDDLSDGQWHSTTKIARRNGKSFSSRGEDLTKTLDSLVSDGILISGANSSFRMKRDYIEFWRSSRDLPMKATTQNMNAPRFFGGILEDDGWEMAPLRTLDVVHFHAPASTSDYVQKLVDIEGMTNYNFEGLVRIFCLNGTKIYNRLRDLKDEETHLEISGIRIDKGTKRRELCDLPSAFVNELCEFYGVFAYALLRQSMSSVRKHIADRDDIQQQIYLWIIDAIQRYDHTTSIPFAAYLHSAMNRWVHDLSRRQYGRAVADSELQLSRVRAKYQTEFNRQPTIEEIAHELGESVEKVNKRIKTVQSVSDIRDTKAISHEDYELPIISQESSTARIEEDTEQSLISAALTTSAVQYKSSPAVVAWCNIYARFWGEGTTDRVSAAERDIMLSMKEKLEEIR